MKSREQLVTRALQKLKVLAAGQSPSAEDYQVVNDDVEPVLSDLSTRNVYPFGDPDQIEDNAFVQLAICLAIASANDFGSPQIDSGLSNEQLRLSTESRLRELTAQTLSGQPLQVDYF
ncbi:hypothetical protein [Mesorhizobium sp. B2-3-2]|uniref:hypothetical protein n=1 Tax=Mesorhizobium sp. B2-3-2 TaxID=2589961 RepID=UPI00112AC6C2|nr:hypothetical protein [Mesorhizobium sp. B2-3-2]TPM37048.1 hypothetical protein FJ964_30405 [Mesorhizobium sp. B2-3-2]